MTLLQLKYISTVAKCGSFSKAAQVLYCYVRTLVLNCFIGAQRSL